MKPILSRFFAVLVGVSLLFGVSPSFAAVDCCDPVAMHMIDGASAGTTSHHDNMPCKMPAGDCASYCASMTGITLLPLPVVFAAPSITGDAAWPIAALPDSVVRAPALPPPIIYA